VCFMGCGWVIVQGWSRGPSSRAGRQNSARTRENTAPSKGGDAEGGGQLRSTTPTVANTKARSASGQQRRRRRHHTKKDQHHFHKMTAGRRHPSKSPWPPVGDPEKGRGRASRVDHSWVESPVSPVGAAISLRPFPRAQQIAPTTEKRAVDVAGTNRLCSQITRLVIYPDRSGHFHAMFSRSTGMGR